MKPSDNRRHDSRASVLMLAGLIAFASIAPSAYRYDPASDTTFKKLARTLYKRGLNQEATANQTAGYYEGLLDQAAGVTQVSGRGWLDWRRWFDSRPAAAAAGNPSRVDNRRARPDYLRYDLPPNVDVPDYDDKRRLVTNSHGMADREYSPRKPDGVWRLALVGDSITRGTGTQQGTNYETRLEDALNRRVPGHYEVLNFGVQGYQITQLVDVVLDRVAPFAPDVYVVALTERSAFRRWTEHLAALVRDRVDLKYDFLKQIVEEAEVTPDHSEALINARLTRYRPRILRWALGEMQSRARADGAEFVVLLVPSADDPEVLHEQFQGVRTLLTELKVLTVDLLDTFAYLPDLNPVRVSSADRHPNEEGHRMLFENLNSRIEADPELRRVFTGDSAKPVAEGAGSR
jgi:hypothetical protein